MKRVLMALSLVLFVGLVGCAQEGEPIGAEAGDAGVSGGTGGEGSGPTGTGGGVPGENPAADVPGPGGTGTDAPQ
jgi:hypothetical protein